MAVTAQSVIERVATTLKDLEATRWATPELVRYLNDGQREIAVFRPDATVKSATMDCVKGAKQSLPADAAKMMDTVRNDTATNTSAVRLVERKLLDVLEPNWYGRTGVDVIDHYMYDERNAREFYVYPPASVNAKLYITYSALPVDVAIPADSTIFSDVNGNIGVADIYANALTDYVLYRAYTKDSEYGGNANRAVAHYSAFTNALNIELTATVGASPKV